MSLNRVFILGNLGKDPDLRAGQGSPSVCRFSVATSDKFKDKTGAMVEKTEWHNIVVFNKLAELCGQYLKKGSKCLVEGKIQYRQYDKDGEKRISLEIIAESIQFLESKPKELDRIMASHIPDQKSKALDNSNFGGQDFEKKPQAKPLFDLDEIPF